MFFFLLFILSCDKQLDNIEQNLNNSFYEEMITLNNNIISYKYNISSNLSVYRSLSGRVDFVNEYNKIAYINRQKLEKDIFSRIKYFDMGDEVEYLSNIYFKNNHTYYQLLNSEWIKITFEEFDHGLNKVEEYGDKLKDIISLIDYNNFVKIKKQEGNIKLLFDIDSEKLFEYVFYNEFNIGSSHSFVYNYDSSSINIDNLFQEKYLILKLDENNYIIEINIKFSMLYSQETTNNKFLGIDAKIEYNSKIDINNINEIIELKLPEKVENARLHSFNFRI